MEEQKTISFIRNESFIYLFQFSFGLFGPLFRGEDSGLIRKQGHSGGCQAGKRQQDRFRPRLTQVLKYKEQVTVLKKKKKKQF